ncbi:MAG: glycoside hydrolase family 9 protein [Verrucomicrobia bacterium]|nr:glycoside hydrolase family 9 protein [Verrucomicrobiota bacterium]
MNKKYTRLILPVLCSFGIMSSGQYAAGMSLDEFHSLADNRVAVRTSLGVRRARAVSSERIELTIGASVTDAAANPAAYRVISFDDPQYAYEKFVRPLSAEIKTREEARGVKGSPFGSFKRTDVVLELPHGMKRQATYHVVAQGVGSTMVTAGHTAATLVYGEDDKTYAPTTEVDLAVIGLRQIEPVGDGIIKLEFGPGFSSKAAADENAYKVFVNGQPVRIVNRGRISRVDTYLPVGWPFPVFPMHEVFLKLEIPYSSGNRILVDVDKSVTAGATQAALTFDERRTLSNSIKVNQVGYVTDSAVKTAYLGRWLGSYPEAVSRATGGSGADELFWNSLHGGTAVAPTSGVSSALQFPSDPSFHVCDAKTREPVFTGTAEFIHRSGVLDEGVFKVDHSGENVYRLNFAELKTPGRYFISVPGVGCSLPFDIGDDVYEKAFTIQASGVFAQRCGMALEPPYSAWHRIACHTKGVIPTTQSRLDGEHDAFVQLPEKVDYGRIKDAEPDKAVVALNHDPDLVAYWPLDGDFRDVSGNGYHLKPLREGQTFVNVPQLMPGGNVALGPTVDGLEDGGSVDGLPTGIDNGLTICGWVRFTGGIKFEGTIFGHAPELWNEPRVQVTAGWGVLRGFAGVRSEPVDIGRLEDGKWHHLAFVISPEEGIPGRMQMYVDGELRSSSVAKPEVDGGTFFVGTVTGDEKAGKYFDDVRVYKRPLKDTELQTLAEKWGELALALPARGGHHDAGDYNPRSHIDVAQVLMNAYEIGAKKFYDGQLNIPEAGNGVPDILDEAAWAFRVWLGLQDEDGGVFGGTESNGDPNFVQTVEMDLLGDYAYAKEAAASYTFAGVMAQASRIWKSLGKTDEAADYLRKAERAYAWAEKHPPLSITDPEKYAKAYISPKAYGAAELLHTTGSARYKEAFRSVNVWSRDPGAELEKHRLYDQRDAAWAYVKCNPEDADPELQAIIRKMIIERADQFIDICSTMAYAFIRHPWAPISWGTGAYENWLNSIIWAYELTGEEKYRNWIIRTCDNTLGANPMNLSYVVGLGSRTVRAPLHNSRYGHSGEVTTGMQVQGPNQSGPGYRVTETAFPRIQETFASLHTFTDSHFAIPLDEGTVNNQVRSMAAFGLLMPDKEQ